MFWFMLQFELFELSFGFRLPTDYELSTFLEGFFVVIIVCWLWMVQVFDSLVLFLFLVSDCVSSFIYFSMLLFSLCYCSFVFYLFFA